MILRAYAVHDSKAEAFLPPFFVQARGQAVRMFSDALQDEKHEFCRHAADYTLFEIGHFDQVEGTLVPQVPVSLGNGLVFKGPELVKEVQRA